MITEITIKLPKEARFSFAIIKEKKYLLSFLGKDLLVYYWEINSQLSGITSDYQIKGKKQNITKEFPYGNCVVNHFYHCFEKYPLLGALQYYFKKYENKSLEFSIFVEKDNLAQLENIKNYLNEIKRICEKNKFKYFGDINFIYNNDINKNKNIKNTSIGFLLIKILEITPIQIAKIMDKEFKIMSDGENIEKKLNIETKKRNILKKDTKINIIDYSKMINFCIKDSIFNYFELPVIVICCFGTQSIGKSTFLNELTGSLFNVSGMRCTEGIWMSIKLFIHSYEEEQRNNCNGYCKNCGKNKCCLLMHEIGKKGKNCICKDCKCNKDCLLNEESNYNRDIIN